jgi:hypothetical protein
MKKNILGLCVCILLMITTGAADDFLGDSASLTADTSPNVIVITETWNGTIATSDRDNSPPVFMDPSPENNSIGNPLNFTWEITINDPEGDLFNWTMECSNGQKREGLFETNGTKSVNLTNLSYSMVYRVWVNATDSAGSGVWNRSWYEFETEAVNDPPVFGVPSPGNGSTDLPLSFTWSYLH